MKFFFALSVLATLALAKDLPVQTTTVFGYLKNIGIPEAERIRKAEEAYLNNPQRVVNGSPTALGHRPYQAGLLINLVGTDGMAVCGASLVSSNRLITAGHCWFDGSNQAWKFTVVLGSVFLFTGGERIETTEVVPHPDWQPSLIRNDVAIIYLPTPVALTDNISPVSLPSGDELSLSFSGETVTVSGFGIKADGAGIATDQFLSHADISVMSNTLCNYYFFGLIQNSNICTSGAGGVGPCGGDSGGPLVTQIGDKTVLVGVVSFGSAFGCAVGWPASYARTTSFIDFFNQHI